MIDLDALLTGRQLVTALREAAVGTWSADAVRQWIREEPPCPVAEHADQGKPHRYRLRPVLEWLRARALGERAKGFTRGDGADLVDRIDSALRGVPAPALSDSARRVSPVEKFNANTSPSPGAGAAAGDEPAAVSQAKATPQQVDWLSLSTEDALLQVLQARDPRNWKAAEEAMVIRRERLEAERRLIPVAELNDALDINTEHTRRNIAAAGPTIKLALREFIKPDRQHAADREIDLQIDQLLHRLAATDDLDAAPSPTSVHQANE